MVTLYTASIIKTNDDVRPEGVFDEQSGKFKGLVNLYKDRQFHTTLLTSQSTYDSEELAVADMNKVIEDIRAVDLDVRVSKNNCPVCGKGRMIKTGGGTPIWEFTCDNCGHFEEIMD